MSNNMFAILAIAVMSIVTIVIRFLPFFVFSGGRKTPPIIEYLGRVLPYSIMAMLVVYCLRGMTFAQVAGYAPHIIAGVLVVASYAWKRNTLLSIVLGTVCYMMLVQMVF